MNSIQTTSRQVKYEYQAVRYNARRPDSAMAHEEHTDRVTIPVSKESFTIHVSKDRGLARLREGAWKALEDVAPPAWWISASIATTTMIDV